MSLLPSQILPQTDRLGTVDDKGNVTIDKNWWLLLYNISQQVLANGQGLSAASLIELLGADSDAADADSAVLGLPISDLQKQVLDSPQVTSNDLPDIARALLWGQDTHLTDPTPAAQPVATITPGASPYSYTAPYWGSVAVTGGTVSAISIIRQGASIGTGVTVGVFQLARGDVLQVTYSVVPTMTFIPGSTQ